MEFWRGTTTLSDGETYVQAITYDPPALVGDPLAAQNSNGYVTSSTEYRSIGLPTVQTISSFGNGTPGPTIQTTNTQYLWQSNPSYYQTNFLELPTSVTVGDGNGNTYSQTTYGYDENNGSPQGVYGD